MIELRGDEALAVFPSARQALRAALDLQEQFAGETEVDPSLPLRVGIGLDAGEAIPVEGGTAEARSIWLPVSGVSLQPGRCSVARR